LYVIMVYDVGVERVSRILKIARKYLTWVQNSVLEGEISKADFTRLKDELRGSMDRDNDSIIFYVMKTARCFRKEVLGVEKGTPMQFF